MNELTLILPEIWMAVFAATVLMVGVFTQDTEGRFTWGLSQLGLLGGLYWIVQAYHVPAGTAFGGVFASDNLTCVLKACLLVTTFAVLLYSQRFLVAKKKPLSEYFSLTLFSVLGMMILISSKTFLVLYLGLELMAFPFYALVAITKEHEVRTEAAMKYFVMGAIASGLLLYGISLLYGATGSFEFAQFSDKLMLAREGEQQYLVLFGMMFVLVGLAFKFGAVPFHMWLPDVYQGAPISVTVFIGTAPKLAAFGMAYRVLAEAFGGLTADWEGIIAMLAVLSLVIGNLLALVQSNLKRLLAYSTIGHVGFIFLGFLVAPKIGYEITLFYVIVYVLTVLGAFGGMLALSHQGFEAENIQDFTGLGEKHPWLALVMMILFFSLAGIPPMAGFYAKFLILQGIINSEYLGLAVVAVVFSVIGAFYYLRVIKTIYFDQVEPGQVGLGDIMLSKPTCIVLGLNGLLVVLVGVMPTVVLSVL